jgi:hypothetical protein
MFFVEILTVKDETTVLSQYFEHHSPMDVVPHPRRMENSTAPQYKPRELPTVCCAIVMMDRN